MTRKQRAFINEYLVDLNGTQAAIRAGYSPRTANRIAHEMLTKPDIQTELEHRVAARAKRTEMDADSIVKRLIAIDQMDVLDILTEEGGVRPVDEWPPIWRQMLSAMDVLELTEGGGEERKIRGVLKRIKWPDKLKNLELLGKHYGLFSDKVDHKHRFTGADGQPLKVVLNTIYVTP